MDKRAWLLNGLSSAIVLAATVGASLPAYAEDTKPPAENAEDEGPFAPKGRTGKLREEQAANTPKSEGGEAAEPTAERKPIAVGLDFVYGFGKSSDLRNAAKQNDVSVESFVLGGKYHKGALGFGLRIPYSLGDVGVSTNALGNIELAGEYALELGPSTRLPIELAIAAPTASGDMFKLTDTAATASAAVNVAAAAARGFEENALFATHRLGIIPRVGLDYERGSILTGAYTKLELGVKIGGEAPPGGGNLAGLTTDWVTGAQFFYEIGQFQLGARAWLAVLLKEAVNDDALSKAQFAVEPAARAKFGPARLGLSYIAPIGGRLSGDTSFGGIRLLIGAEF